MDAGASWIRLFATLALLVTLVVSARGLRSTSRVVDAPFERCEINPPRDVDGLERCLALLPKDVELMLDLASAHEAQGASDRAEALYRRALDVDPQDGDLHIRLGRVLLARGDSQRAAERAKTALRLQPRSVSGHALLEQATRRGDQ